MRGIVCMTNPSPITYRKSNPFCTWSSCKKHIWICNMLLRWHFRSLMQKYCNKVGSINICYYNVVPFVRDTNPKFVCKKRTELEWQKQIATMHWIYRGMVPKKWNKTQQITEVLKVMHLIVSKWGYKGNTL